jgi:hypothetical protein
MQVCTSCKRLLEADARQCPADGADGAVVETLPKGAVASREAIHDGEFVDHPRIVNRAAIPLAGDRLGIG